MKNTVSPELQRMFNEWVERQKPPTKTERELSLADTLQRYNDIFSALVSEWAHLTYFLRGV